MVIHSPDRHENLSLSAPIANVQGNSSDVQFWVRLHDSIILSHG